MTSCHRTLGLIVAFALSVLLFQTSALALGILQKCDAKCVFSAAIRVQ